MCGESEPIRIIIMTSNEKSIKHVEIKFAFYLALIMALAINVKMEMTMNMTAVITTYWVIARVEGWYPSALCCD